MNTATHNLSIGPLADRFGVCPETLRLWERQGLLPPSTRTPGGHRRYGPQHVEALRRLFGEPLATPQTASR